jgi:hypothetical protein
LTCSRGSINSTSIVDDGGIEDPRIDCGEGRRPSRHQRNHPLEAFHRTWKQASPDAGAACETANLMGRPRSGEPAGARRSSSSTHENRGATRGLPGTSGYFLMTPRAHPDSRWWADHPGSQGGATRPLKACERHCIRAVIGSCGCAVQSRSVVRTGSGSIWSTGWATMSF